MWAFGQKSRITHDVQPGKRPENSHLDKMKSAAASLRYVVKNITVMPITPPNSHLKTDLRRSLRARRNALSDTQRNEFSRRICEHLRIWLLTLDASIATIAIYQAHRREVDLNELLNLNFDFVTPRRVGGDWISAEEREVFEKYEPLKWHAGVPSEQQSACADNLNSKFVRAGGLSMAKPSPACHFNGSYKTSQIDIFLVPSLAFDTRGQRIGQGGGWYDRVLARAPHALKIGVAFACQIVENVPHEAHDVTMDGVVTENGWCKYLQDKLSAKNS